MTEYFEDVRVGDSREFGAYEVTAGEIREFAEQYDPQPMHTDPESAEALAVGGLIASGWHTAAITMRLLVDNLISEQASGVGKGVDELRWPRPVRPGDVLSVRTEVLDAVPRDDGRGELRLRVETRTADGEVVLSMVSTSLLACREA
jgi:acyl dehydratase